MNSTVAFVSDGRGKGFYWDGVGMKGRGRGLNRELDSFPNTGVLAGEHHGCLYTKSGGGGGRYEGRDDLPSASTSFIMSWSSVSVGF